MVEFRGQGLTGSRFMLKNLGLGKYFFDFTLTDFQTGRQKIQHRFRKLSVSKIQETIFLN